jgi:2-oxoglutarate ferredoxin oxidoreductase subunit gamma
MIERVIIAGAGGQGIMVLGKVLAEAALRENKHVIWLPAYGPEVRGGTAHCTVIISDEPIASPYIKQADDLIIMNEPSLKKFQSRVKESGLLVVNSSLVKEKIKATFEVQSHPFTDTAIALGNSKIANMVALGCFIAKKNLVTPKSALEAIAYMAPPDKPQLIEINTKALHAGMAFVAGGNQT